MTEPGAVFELKNLVFNLPAPAAKRDSLASTETSSTSASSSSAMINVAGCSSISGATFVLPISSSDLDAISKSQSKSVTLLEEGSTCTGGSPNLQLRAVSSDECRKASVSSRSGNTGNGRKTLSALFTIDSGDCKGPQKSSKWWIPLVAVVAAVVLIVVVVLLVVFLVRPVREKVLPYSKRRSQRASITNMQPEPVTTTTTSFTAAPVAAGHESTEEDSEYYDEEEYEEDEDEDEDEESTEYSSDASDDDGEAEESDEAEEASYGDEQESESGRDRSASDASNTSERSSRSDRDRSTSDSSASVEH